MNWWRNADPFGRALAVGIPLFIAFLCWVCYESALERAKPENGWMNVCQHDETGTGYAIGSNGTLMPVTTTTTVTDYACKAAWYDRHPQYQREGN